MSELYPSAGALIPIEPNRRLVRSNTANVQEFYSTELNSRIISMPVRDDTTRSHEELVELRLPVFSGLYRDTELWLTVPEGSRPLGRVLRFIARDLQNYSEIFYKLGGVFKQLDRTGIGFPQATAERSALDSFVFSVDEHELYGGNIYLAPPYVLNPDKTIGQALGSVAVELEKSNQFSAEEITVLMQMTDEGFSDG